MVIIGTDRPVVSLSVVDWLKVISGRVVVSLLSGVVDRVLELRVFFGVVSRSVLGVCVGRVLLVFTVLSLGVVSFTLRGVLVSGVSVLVVVSVTRVIV